MVIVLVVAGLLGVWLATEFGWFGLSADSVSHLRMGYLLAALLVLVLVWLWRRRARWH